MEDFWQNDNLAGAIHNSERQMSNDKPREVKGAAASELHRSRHTQVVAAQPIGDVVDRPRLLSDRCRSRNGRREIENDDIVLETFTLPLEAARLEVRAIIDDISPRGYQKIVERWRQLPDGQIEFTMRRLPATD
jgi:hypothetical protein